MYRSLMYIQRDIIPGLTVKIVLESEVATIQDRQLSKDILASATNNTENIKTHDIKIKVISNNLPYLRIMTYINRKNYKKKYFVYMLNVKFLIKHVMNFISINNLKTICVLINIYRSSSCSYHKKIQIITISILQEGDSLKAPRLNEVIEGHQDEKRFRGLYLTLTSNLKSFIQQLSTLLGLIQEFIHVQRSAVNLTLDKGTFFKVSAHSLPTGSIVVMSELDCVKQKNWISKRSAQVPSHWIKISAYFFISKSTLYVKL